MGSGLIYVVIIGVWAVVLVPTWLRQHDHADPERTVDRFARNMALLASRPAVEKSNSLAGGALNDNANDGYISRPSGNTQSDVRVVTRPSAARNSRGRAARAARRRRNVLAVLTGVLLAVAATVVAGMLPALTLAVPFALIIGFVVVARTQVRKGQSQAGQRQAVAGRTTHAPQAGVGRPQAGSGLYGNTWEARTTPLPTYVTAPPASAVPRRIDTETPGAWTAAAMLERAQQEKARAERMEAAKRDAIARARAEQLADQARSRDDDYLAAEAAENHWAARQRRRVVNE